MGVFILNNQLVVLIKHGMKISQISIVTININSIISNLFNS